MNGSADAIGEHKQLTRIVADRIRAMIAEGRLAPGEWLRQERLATELGISYTPIREALKQLEVEGLVEHVPYRGARVIEVSADDVEDIYSMRGVLEGLAASAAAQRLTEADFATLTHLHETMSGLHGIDQLDTLHDLNRQFHLLIINACGRRFLIRTLTMLYSWFPTMLWNPARSGDAQQVEERERLDNSEHAEILATLHRRDSATAEQLMREHIDGSRRSLMQRWEMFAADSVR